MRKVLAVACSALLGWGIFSTHHYAFVEPDTINLGLGVFIIAVNILNLAMLYFGRKN